MSSKSVSNSFLILEILKRIPRKEYTCSTVLRGQLEAAGYPLTIRAIQRWLEAIVTAYPIECDDRSKPYGYRWMAGAEGVSLPLLSPSEALLFQLARGEVAQMLPAKALKSLAPLFSSAHKQLSYGVPPPDEKRWLSKVRRIPDNQPLLASETAPTIFETISDALFNEQVLHLSYTNVQCQTKNASVWPLALVQQGNRCYLVCRFEGYDNERILALPRIISAQMGMRFAYPRDFDLSRYLEAGNFGIRRGPMIRLTFTITRAEGLHLAESPLSEDQQLYEDAEGLHITATLPETELLHRWLRGWGTAIKNIQIAAIEETTVETSSVTD